MHDEHLNTTLRNSIAGKCHLQALYLIFVSIFPDVLFRKSTYLRISRKLKSLSTTFHIVQKLFVKNYKYDWTLFFAFSLFHVLEKNNDK